MLEGGAGMVQATERTKEELASVSRTWVETVGGRIPGLYGAFLHGSILDKADDTLIPATSDVDLVVVLDEDDPPVKPGKLVFQRVLLDVTYIPLDLVRSPDGVLANYHLAPSVAGMHILADPTGGLAELHAAVSKKFAVPEWIERRVYHAKENVLDKLCTLQRPGPLHDHVMAWLFAAGILCHVLLVAGLKSPTVRKRYAAARSLLEAHGREEVYEALLEVLGCSTMSPDRAKHHLDRMTAAFDDAKAATNKPFFFASDISDLARPISVDGSREMIEQGDHREAIFWIVATYCRCLKIFEADGSEELFAVHSRGFAELIADLGIEQPKDIERRAADVQAALPIVMNVARVLMKGPSL